MVNLNRPKVENLQPAQKSDSPPPVQVRGHWIIGHRGAPLVRPENTWPSLAQALAEGADGLEFDVRVTQDDVWVLHHDISLARIFGDVRAVSRVSWDELTTMRAASGAKITSLEPLVCLLERRLEEGCPPVDFLNVEVKVDRDIGTCELGWHAEAKAVSRLALDRLACALVALENQGHGLVVSSFNWPFLARLNQRLNCAARLRLKVGLLVDEKAENRLKQLADWRKQTGARALHPDKSLCTSARVRAWREAGLDVTVYTVDQVNEARTLFQMGVTGVITNRPGNMVREINRGLYPRGAQPTSLDAPRK